MDAFSGLAAFGPAVGPSEKLRSMKVENPTYLKDSFSKPKPSVNTSQPGSVYSNTGVPTSQVGSVYSNTGVTSFARSGPASGQRDPVTVNVESNQVSYQNFGESGSREEENPYDVLPDARISQAPEYTILTEEGAYYQM